MSKYALLVAAVVLACTAVQTHARVLRFEKILTAVIDDQDIDIEALLQNALSDEDGEDLEFDVGEAVGGCSGGICKYCKVIDIKIAKEEFCLIAKVLKLGFDLTITMDGKTLYHTKITVIKPFQVCISAPSPLTKLGKICIKVDKINIAKMSACVYIVFKIGPITHTSKIACFNNGKADDNQAMQIESENSVETDDALRYTGFLTGYDVILY